jgi:thiamine pyrophosphokinase
MTIKNAIVFFGGDYFHHQNSLLATELQAVKLSNYFCATADHGADLAFKCGLTPHLVMGDDDSISSLSLTKIKKQNIPHSFFPSQKDQTDSELVLDYLSRHHLQNVTIFGLEGSRLDHFLANIFLLGKFAKQGMQIKAIGESAIYYFVTKSIKISGHRGDLLSLLALTSTVKKITTSGLEYQLAKRNLSQSTSLGISNVFVKRQIKIDLESGVLLAITIPKLH